MNGKQLREAVRKTVWNRYNGTNFVVPCFVNCGNNITAHNYECGHVISRNEGGNDTIENLRTICSPCNISMGTANMEEFIAKHGFKTTLNTSLAGNLTNSTQDLTKRKRICFEQNDVDNSTHTDIVLVPETTNINSQCIAVHKKQLAKSDTPSGPSEPTSTGDNKYECSLCDKKFKNRKTSWYHTSKSEISCMKNEAVRELVKENALLMKQKQELQEELRSQRAILVKSFLFG